MHLFSANSGSGGKFGEPSSFLEKLDNTTVATLLRVGVISYSQAIVVFILPTLANREIFAKSIANSGVSAIFSRRTLEHRGDAIIVRE